MSIEEIIDAACPFELPMMGFLTAGAGAGVEAEVEVAIPEKSAKSPVEGAGLLLMNPKAEPEDVEGAATGVGAVGVGGAAAGGGLMNPKPDGVDEDVGRAAKGSAGF